MASSNVKEESGLKLLGEFVPSSLEDKTSSVTKEGFEVLSSYNWVEAAFTTVMVTPGSPAIWTEPTLPMTVTADTGKIFIDQNAASYHTSPLAPLLQALHMQQARIDLNTVDIITDCITLQRLFSFVAEGTLGQESDTEFEVGLEVINNTVLFTCLEKEATEYIRRGTFKGFDLSFQKRFTQLPADVKHSTGHYRIVRYKLGGLNLVVRFEGDVSVDNSFTEVEVLEIQDERTPRTIVHSSDDEKILDLISKAMPGINLGHGNYEPELPKLTPEPIRVVPLLQVRNIGQLQPDACIVHLLNAVIGKGKRINISEHMPQLWLSNVHDLFVGYHRHGAFVRIDKLHFGDGDFKDWENENKMQLGKMVDLLEGVVKLARTASYQKCRMACSGGTLKVFEMEKWKDFERGLMLLPAAFRTMWREGR